MNPLVTIFITSKDRPDDLRFTLTSLREQSYRNLEILVVDDGSERSFESVLGRDFPEAVFIRHEKSHGLIASRSGGFQIARGAYLISLDDDSNFCHDDAIRLAVDRMEREPDIALLAFRIVQGRAVTPHDYRPEPEYYCHTFVGCGHMFRQEATRRIGGYMDFFLYGGEEEEYGLRALADGWKMLYFPQVLVHHRVSSIGRNQAKIAAYTFRNNVWTLFLRMPIAYAALHAVWKCGVHCSNTLKHKKLDWGWWGFQSCFTGLARVFGRRKSIGMRNFLLWQALRRKEIRTLRDFESVRDASRWQAVSSLARQVFRKSRPLGSAG